MPFLLFFSRNFEKNDYESKSHGNIKLFGNIVMVGHVKGYKEVLSCGSIRFGCNVTRTCLDWTSVGKKVTCFDWN